ncbi:MAG TPA: hypothetical protein PLC40_12775 [Candidatus Hydrogenedentes bacterium]|nr:hypothetical protein [Candidatus Hydrogenedentota bacterium]
MPIEYEHPDVLQNIEFAVVSLYKRHREMSDYDVLRVYENLFDDYKEESQGRQPRRHNQSELEQQLYDDIKIMCEWRLGRALPFEDAPPMENTDSIPVDILLQCLKRLIKSVNRWTKGAGRQGYLNFIIQHVI